MKGTCKECGQRIHASDGHTSTGRVVNCPQCGLPVKVGQDRSVFSGSVTLAISNILLTLALALTVYYAIRFSLHRDVDPYTPNVYETIAYAVALAFSFCGFFVSLFGALTNIVERYRHMLTLVITLALTIFWAAWFLATQL